MKNFYLIIVLMSLYACQEKEIRLFNSNDLDGWVNYGGGKFYVEDGCIVAESIYELPNTFLHTEKKYRDFILEFDVKLDTVLNSGVQIEIDPTSRSWSGAIYEEGGRGFLHTPGINEKVKAAFKPLQWNHFKVYVKGDHIQSWINDVMIADVYDNLTTDGYIALQLHGIGQNSLKVNKKIRWKNLILKVL